MGALVNSSASTDPMPTDSHPAILSADSLSFSFNSESGVLTATDPASGNLLFRTTAAGLFRPVLNNAVVPVQLKSVHQEHRRSVALHYESALLTELVVRFTVSEEDAIDVRCTFRPIEASQLNRLQLLPEGTELNLFDAHTYRNRHHTSATAPELPLGAGGCSTDTYSGDWQFTPHPSALLLRANETALFCGALDLPKSFGLHFSAADYLLRHWHLDYGSAPHGQPLSAGELYTSPRFRFFCRHQIDPARIYAEFGAMLVKAKIIADPRQKKRSAWWTAPLYCTWVDQVYGADAKLADSLHEQALAAAVSTAKSTPVSVLIESLVDQAVEVIERENLPIRTILLDDGWQIARGQWEPHPQRFPDLRALVDRLHAKGFKVVVWWNWAEIQAHAQVIPAHVAGNGWINRHGSRVRDYSNPLTQDDYLKPLFQKLFSNAPGCYDLDGVKTDFLADKVHPDMPLHDPEWRGEENYIFNITRLFYTEMRRHKSDAIHIGGAGHYWLAEFIDVNRTYDVHNSNWREHEERARMLQATTPGCPVAYDFHQYTENLSHWFASARAHSAAIEIGNVLWTKTNRFSPVAAADAEYFETLRNELSQTSEDSPATDESARLSAALHGA